MGHQSYILFVSCEEDKQRILEAIKAHNAFYDDKPDEGMNDPNFKEEVGEELEGLVYTKLFKKQTKDICELYSRHFVWKWRRKK